MKLISLIAAASLIVFSAAYMAMNWGFSPTLAFALALGILLLLWRPKPPLEEPTLPVGTELVFEGQYIAHWEVARFEWFRDGRPWQGWKTQYMCQLRFSDKAGWSWLDEAVERAGGNLRHGPSLCFRMQFLGRVAEVGRFGHLGMCRYVIEVLEMLHVEQIDEAQRT